ncbi:MAG: LysR family transcriptional regulator [Clostridia bacterium]
MTVMQAQVFLAVVDTGSFTKAGERLNLSQSGVSHTISGLEAELGIQLLVRNRQGIRLTEAGERILMHAREIINRVEQIRQIAADTLGMAVGTIRIGSFPSVSARVLPGVIRSFQTKFPHIELVFCEGSYGQITQWLQTGEVDVGFVILPAAGLDATPLIDDQLLAVVEEKHPLSRQKSVSVEQLAEEPFILPLSGCERLVQEAFRQSGLSPQIRFEIADNPTILAMVNEGLGVSIVPQLTLPKHAEHVKVLPLQQKVGRTIGLAVSPLMDAAPAVRAFMQTAEQWVKEHLATI